MECVYIVYVAYACIQPTLYICCRCCVAFASVDWCVFVYVCHIRGAYNISGNHIKSHFTQQTYIYIYIHSCSTSHSTTQHAGDSGNRVLNSVCSFSENDATNVALGMTGIAMQAASTPVDASSKNARQCVELTFPARSQTLLMVLQICGKL